MLTDAQHILRDVLVLFLNTGSDQRMLGTKIHVIPAVEEIVLIVWSWRKRPID